ncbi:MAG: hypothetical protein RBS72_10715 [Sedimentisphaerales bacterium]|nr:hypothetical protein [Sedimentisphaerales bacterium]HOC63550.1 hypothetical protein [Sedimentisphaerales bacterium]HQA88987.1 hypothetical protein [Sedimentisphaerales bacterium]HQN34522.1 hypothetical protein [Sedimentisphaerales bacterium]
MGESIMKTSFIAENRGFLRLCAGAARFYGLLFLFLAGMMVALPAFLMLSGMEADKLRFWLGAMTLWRLLSLVLGGLLALALAELITYVMEGEGAPKWILQHADKVLFVYAAFSTVVRVCLAASTISHGSRWRSSEIISVAFMLLHAIATPLILVGIGIALRKILPIIQESKTLV